MNKFRCALFFLALSLTAGAQDERYFRQLFSGELRKSFEPEYVKKYSLIVHTPAILLDLNRDAKPERVLFVKKDGEDWIDILDENRTKIFSYQLENKGFDSELFRMELKTLSSKTSVLLLYYYEGVSRYLEMNGTARVYAITIDDNDLKTLHGFKGPSFFEERKPFKGNYYKRNYQVYTEDLNGDSVKELVLKSHLTSTVFWYKGQGKWATFNQ